MEARPVPRSPLPGAGSLWSLCCRVAQPVCEGAGLPSAFSCPAPCLLPPAPSPQESHLPGLPGLQAVGGWCESRGHPVRLYPQGPEGGHRTTRQVVGGHRVTGEAEGPVRGQLRVSPGRQAG